MNAMGVSSWCLRHTSFRFMTRVVQSIVSSPVWLHGLGGSLASPNNFLSHRRTYSVRQVEPLPPRTSHSPAPGCPPNETVVRKAGYIKSSTKKEVAGSGRFDRFRSYFQAGLCWFALSPSVSAASKNLGPMFSKAEAPSQSQTGSRLSGWRGGC